MVKVEKAITNEAHKAKKVAKLVAAELGSTKKISKKPKGEREKKNWAPQLRKCKWGGIKKGVFQGESL